jgi:hypothetical protein
MTGYPVVLFRNAAHGGMSVVYRRPDGNVGWIDPERTAPNLNGGALNGDKTPKSNGHASVSP